MNYNHININNKKSERLKILVFLSITIIHFLIVGCKGNAPGGTTTTAFADKFFCHDTIIEAGWSWSYQAGYYDSNGHYAGGTETLHVLGHKDRLYAANGYWEDSSNVYYGGSNFNANWAQILRLDSPDGQWEVDLEMGPTYLRAEILKSVTFTTDGNGNPLIEPVNLLVAGAWSRTWLWPWSVINTEVTVFVRDDATGNWSRNTVYTVPGSGSDFSCRFLSVYRDTVTGVDRIFFGIGVKGVWSGVYDPGVPGKIRWDGHSESGDVAIRSLAMIEANNSLLFSSGKLIYRRNDGVSPSYTVVHDMSDLYPGVVDSGIGGIRGMTKIPNPNGAGDSILFAWCPNTSSQSCMYRLDPDGAGGYTRYKEMCLGDLSANYLSIHVWYVLSAYNDMLPVVDPATSETLHIIGVESWTGQNFNPSSKGFYQGGMYAIRSANGAYRVKEVNGRWNGCKPILVAPRAYTLSPFNGEKDAFIYFGGWDGNNMITHNSAWIFKTSVEEALK